MATASRSVRGSACPVGRAPGTQGMRESRETKRPSPGQTKPSKEQIVNPLVLILVVILIVSLLGGGYGLRSGNAVLGAGGGLVGLVLLILLILALLGRLPL